MTPVVRNNWKVYAKNKPHWKEIYNSDAKKYWGTGEVLNPDIDIKMVDKKEEIFELDIHLPALGAVILK
jgi:1,4-alpha-glucan branching enzyme